MALGLSAAERDSLSDSEELRSISSISVSLERDRNTTHPITPHTKDERTTESSNRTSGTYEHYILNNIRNLVHDESLSDIVFIVEEEELYGIRSLFASQSIVFRQMLYGSMIESQRDAHVILTDITVDAFKYLRNTFYNLFDNPLSPSIVVEVLFAAQKYLIDSLTTKCLQFIKQIEDLNDWFVVFTKFEESPFQLQSKLYLNQILNQDDTPYILQYKSLKFVQHQRFKYLKRETIILLINSDYLAAKEDDIWESLLRWTRFNASHKQRKHVTNSVDQKQDSENENDNDDSFSASEKALMDGFIGYIRFNQMDAMYFKENIVDKKVLPPSDVINIMFARENGTQWKSAYNDNQRIKSKTMDTFQLGDICLSLQEIVALKVGDLIDFRDYYGLFCAASVIDVDHNQNRIKIHYNSWGSTYDEWYHYLASDADDDDANADVVRLKQEDKNNRIAKYGSITNRKIKNEYFRSKIEEFTASKAVQNNTINHECQVKLPNWFWKKNESYINNKQLYINKWLNAKVIGYKTAAKYSDHVKIGIYIHDDHFEYWMHPDNDEEVRPGVAAKHTRT
eukprot:255194_1